MSAKIFSILRQLEHNCPGQQLGHGGGKMNLLQTIAIVLKTTDLGVLKICKEAWHLSRRTIIRVNCIILLVGKVHIITCSFQLKGRNTLVFIVRRRKTMSKRVEKIDVDIFEKEFSRSQPNLLYRDVILVPPRSLCELRVRCLKKNCQDTVNAILSVPYRRDGSFISDEPLSDIDNRPTNHYRTRMIAMELKPKTMHVISYACRDGALWVAASSQYWMDYYFTCTELSPDVYQYACTINGQPEQVIFTVEKRILRENLLIRELKCVNPRT